MQEMDVHTKLAGLFKQIFSHKWCLSLFCDIKLLTFILTIIIVSVSVGDG